MIKSCKSCNYLRTMKDSGAVDCCPKCGVYYSKIEKVAEVEAVTPAPVVDEVSSVTNIEDNKFQRIFDLLEPWAKGKESVNIFYAILFLFIFYTFVRYLGNTHYVSWFDGISLGIHEGGHPLFHGFGRFLHVFGGTFCEVSAPVICGGYLLVKQKDFIGPAFCLAWLGSCLINVAIYMADANELVLQLVTVGNVSPEPVPRELVHDWYILFNDYFGILKYCDVVAFITGFCGYLCFIIALFWSGFLIWFIYKFNTKNNNLNDV